MRNSAAVLWLEHVVKARVLAFYASFSVAAYAAFGSATQQIVVLNITEGYIAAAVQLSMSAVVALTTPIVRPAPH
eukprot:tig00020629_g12375.t1